MNLAPLHVVRSRCWDVTQMRARIRSWVFTVGEGTRREAAELLEWGRSLGSLDPVAVLRDDSIATPHLASLAASVRRELDVSGVALVCGFRCMSEEALRLAYMKLGLALGTPIETYGRLYEVRDTGVSYRDVAVPVSQTRESTGMHTDSSGKDVAPRVVGLACVRQAPRGGGTRLVSAALAHEVLRRDHPQLLARLYDGFVRDVVTPGDDRDPERVSRNRFPVFSYSESSGALCLRYMRFWIERGHERCGEPLDDEAWRAFDALDAVLSDPSHVLSFRMEPGDFLFVDNTLVAHDREAYEEDPASPRLMLRLWLDAHAHEGHGG